MADAVMRLVLALLLGVSVPARADCGAPNPAEMQEAEALYLPTPHPVVEAMLRLAKVSGTDIVYDLGSGDGRIPIAAARTYGARGVGIELDTFYLRDALDNRAKAGVADRVTFV